MRTRPFPPPLPPIVSDPSEFARQPDYVGAATSARDLARAMGSSHGAATGTRVVTPDPFTVAS